MARLTYLASLLAVACSLAKADIAVYTDGALDSPWQDWSWSSTIDYGATDIFEGSSSISVTSEAYSALSLYNPTPFPTAAGLEFDVAVSTLDTARKIEPSSNDQISRETSLTCRLSSKTQRTTPSRRRSLCRHLAPISQQTASRTLCSTSTALRRTGCLSYVILYVAGP